MSRRAKNRRDNGKQQAKRTFGPKLYFESMEDRSLPAVTATLLGGGLLDINYTADNDTATLSTAGANLSVVSNSGTTNFSIAAVHAINAHSSSGNSQSITFGGNLNLSGQVTATGLASVTFFCGYSAAGINVNAKGSIVVNNSLLGVGSGGDISLVTLVTVSAATNGALGSSANGAATINIFGATELTGANITLDAQTNIAVDAEGDASSDTNRDFSRLTTTSTATITIEDQAQLIADGGISVFAKSKVVASATAEAKATSTNAAIDAAVALNTVTSSARVEIFDDAFLDAVDIIGLTAINDTSMTTIADGTTSNATGKGGSVAIAKADKSTFVTVAGTIFLDADDIQMTANSITNSTTTALSSVGGSTANDSSTTSELSAAGAATADGSIGLAAAVAIHRLLGDITNATVNMAGTIGTRGSLDISANATTNATVTANAGNTGAGQVTPPAGVGVAVAINKGAPSHVATLTGTALLNTPNISILALEPITGVHNTTATAGVGASTVGVAGSFALTDIDKTATARVGSFFNNDIGNTAMSLQATGNSSETTNANAVQQIISGNPRFGVGAAAAFNRSNRTTKAEVEDNSNIIGGSWQLSANANHLTNTNATIGSAGGVATSAGVALSQNVNDTFARLGSGTSFLDFAGGAVVLAANHTGSTTVTTHGEVAGSTVAVGAVLAMADVQDKAHVNIDRSMDASSLNASANTSSFVSSTATGSAKGTSSSQTANQQIDQQNNNASRPSAQTADGVFGAAAALGVNVAISESRVNVANNVVLGVNGPIILAAANETDTFAKGDASVLADSNQATTVGLAAAVGINKSTVTNEATVGTNANLFGSSLTMQATMRDAEGNHSGEANAVSGAGGRKVGIAGALALNVQDTVTQVVLKSGTTVNGLTGAANLNASNRRIQNAKASPGAGGVSGDSVGVGASVAINVLDNTTKTEIEANARIAQGASLSMAANSVGVVLTDANGGAGSQTSGGAVAVTPVVALTVLDDTTLAVITAGTVAPTTVSGAANLSSTHSGSTTTKAEGSTVATQVAVGLSLAVAVEDVDTNALVGKLTAGSLGVVASSVTGSVMSAKANAKGGETSSGTTVDQKVQSQKNFGDSQSGETHNNADSASSGEGGVALAGAVAVRIGTVDTRAAVVAAGQLTTTGLASLQALENVDATIDANADTVGTGSQSGGSGLGIAAAVAINSSTTSTKADVAGVPISTRGLTLQTGMASGGGNAISASDIEAVSGAGNTGVGLAGALAINKDTKESAAVLTSSATVGTGAATDDVTILAANTTTAAANARASTVASKVGVGASVAINTLNRVTRAEIQGGAAVAGADGISIAASSDHTATTDITVGNTGGTAVSPGVAIGVVNSTTFADTGAGSQITSPGLLSVSASHIGSTTTNAHGETNGSNVAVGAVLAINDINDKATTTLSRNLSFTQGINAASDVKSVSIANAFASAKGTNSSQQADAQINQQRTIADRDSAETAEGKLAAAAALGINIARTDSRTMTTGTMTLATGGVLSFTSSNETDSSAKGDSSALSDGSANPTVGVAVGLGLNKTVINNQAILTGTTTANSNGLSLTAGMRDGAGRHDSTAEGISGAGGKKVGIAGSLGLNIVDNVTFAGLRGSSTANPGSTGVTAITATNRRNETAKASARADAGAAVGVGASVAINILDNATRAEVDNTARFVNGGATTLTATSVETVLTDATGGSGRQDAAGNITVTPVVALTVLDDLTQARVGAPSGTSNVLTGSLTLNASHDGSATTSAVGSTTATGVAVGMSIAVAVEDIDTKATLGKGNITGAVTMNANSHTASSVVAKASAKGGESSATPLVDVKVSEQKNFGDSKSGTTHSTQNSASTSDGGVNVAGAVGVRVGNVDAVVGVESLGSLLSQSAFTATAKQNADVNMTVDGLAVGTGSQAGQPASGLGIAAAIAINSSTTNTEAKIADAPVFSTRGAKLETGVLAVGGDTTSTTSISATSGIGNSNVGVAGSLALNVDRHISTAKVDTGAAVVVGPGTPAETDDLTLVANNNTNSSATATAKVTGSGGSTKAGVGASVALEIVKNETVAIVDTNVGVGGADDILLTATGTHANNATVEAGSAGAVAVSPAVALLVATGDTLAQIKSGATITVKDDVAVQATRNNASTTVAGATAAAGNVAVGVALALTVAEDDATALLDRSVTSTTGDIDVFASNTSATFATSTASSKGGPTAGDDSDQATQNQQDFGQNLSGGGTGGSNFSTKVSNAKANLKSSTNTKGGTDVADNGNAFAAAIAANVTAPTTSASIGGNRTVTTGGAVAVRTDVDTTAEATANGTAVSGGATDGVSVGAALGVNVGLITNTALIGAGTTINSAGVTVRADHGAGDTHSFRAEAIAGGGGQQSGIAASLGLNIITDSTTAKADDQTHLNSSGPVLIRADNDIRMLNIAGGAAKGANRGVGAALAGNVIVNGTTATIGSNASVVAVGSVTVEADATIAPMTGELAQNPAAVAAGGAASQSSSVAGSAAVNVITDSMLAVVSTFTTVTVSAGAGGLGDLIVRATDDTSIKSGGGAIVASLANGFGGGIAVDVLIKNVQAFIAGTSSGSPTSINAANDVIVEATSTETQKSFAAATTFTQGTGIAGGASVYVPNTTTIAFVGANRSMLAAGNFTIAANHTADIDANAGTFTAGLGNSAGIGLNAIVATDYVEAALAGGASLATAGAIGLIVEAHNAIDVSPLAVGGSGSAGSNMVGSGNATVLDETVKAHIDVSTTVNANNASTSIDPSVLVEATNSTIQKGIGGTATGAGSMGIGVGADAFVLNKSTLAWVDHTSTITADKDVRVIADSSETVVSVAAAFSAGGSSGLAGAATVVKMDITTRAILGENPAGSVGATFSTINASNNVVVEANDITSLDAIGGNASVSGSASVGAAAVVPVIHKLTEAFIGQRARVRGDGVENTSGIKSGLFAVAFDNDVVGFGEVTTLNPNPVDQNGDGANDIADEQFGHSRIATPGTVNFRGVAVTSTSVDDIEMLAIGGGVSGSVAVNAAVPVAVLSSDTFARIGANAQVNQDQSAANGNQTVQVSAASDQSILTVSGVGAISGVASFGPTANVLVVNNQTKASIDAAALATASNDIVVQAKATEDVLAVAAGVAGSGAVGVAGSVDVVKITTVTDARIKSSAQVVAFDTVDVIAIDTTEVDAISGAAGVGFAGVGAGASVNYVSVSKDTSAIVESNANVDGKAEGVAVATGHGVNVTAIGNEDIHNFGLAAGGGLVGLGGGVLVTVVDADTVAAVESNAHVNNQSNNEGVNQNVAITATGVSNVKTIAGGFALGGGALAGAVDMGSVRNDATARVGANAQVDAAKDIFVKANETQTISGTAISAAAGAVGLAGSVSVWSIGSTFNSNYTNDVNATSNAIRSNAGSGESNDKKFADHFVGKQAADSHGRLSGFLDDYKKPASATPNPTPIERVGLATESASFDLIASGPAQTGVVNDLSASVALAGTSATVEAGASLNAGGDIEVSANDNIDVDVSTGQLAVGLLGAGAAVTVVQLRQATTALVSGALSAGDDIVIRAQQISGTAGDKMNFKSFAGNGGFIGLGAAVTVVNDNSRQSAKLEGTVVDADQVAVEATQAENAFLDARQLATGFVAGGATFTRFTKDDIDTTVPRTGFTEAIVTGSLGDSANTIGGLAVTASQNVVVSVNSKAVAGGVASGTGSFAEISSRRSSNSLSTVKAQISGGTANAAGNINVQSTMTHSLTALTTGISIGGVTGGASKATIFESQIAEASIADSKLDAAGNVTVATNATVNPNAQATCSQGALVTVSGEKLGAFSSLDAIPIAKASIRESIESGNTSVDAGGSMSITSNVSLMPHSQATSNSIGLIGTGRSRARANVSPGVSAVIGDGVEASSAGAFTLSSHLTSINPNYANSNNKVAVAKSTADSFLAEAIAVTSVEMLPSVDAAIGDGAEIIAGGLVQLDARIIDIDMLTEAVADASGRLDSDSSAVNKSRIGGFDINDRDMEFANGAGVSAAIGAANVTGNAVEILATVDHAQVYVLADSVADHGLTTPNAVGWSQLSIFVTAEVDDNANVRGDDHIDVKAKQNIVETRSIVQSFDEGITDRDTIVEGQNTQTTTSRIFGEDFARLTTRKLNVEAFVVPVALDMTATIGGELSPDADINYKPVRTIEWESEVDILGAVNPLLIVDVNGNIAAADNVNVVSNTASAVTIGPINHTVPFTPWEPIKFKTNVVTIFGNTLKGTIEGFTSVFTFVRTFDTVTIQNFSTKSLLIDDINVIQFATPTVVLDVEDLTAVSIHFGFDTVHRYNPTVITIENLGATGSPDITLDSIMNNPIGELHINNLRGDILAVGRNAHTVSKLFLNAPLGDIGTSATRMRFFVTQSADSSNLISANAGGDIHLKLKGQLRQLPGTQTLVINVAAMDAGGSIDLLFEDAVKQLLEVGRPSTDVKEVFPPPADIVNVLGRYLPPIEESLAPFPLGALGGTTGSINSTYSFANTFADADIFLTAQGGSSAITITGSMATTANGSVSLTRLTGSSFTLLGGTGINAFELNDWGGAIVINGQAGNDTLSLNSFDGSVNSQDQLSLQSVTTRPGTVAASIAGSVRLDDVVIFDIADIAGVDRDLLVSATVHGPGRLIKQGLGGMSVTSNSTATFIGATQIDAGFLAVDGNMSASQVFLNGGALAGIGVTGPVSGVRGRTATVSPGINPTLSNNLDTKQLSLVATDTYLIQLNGLTAGIAYDQIDVTGSVLLGGATLSGALNFASAVGDVFRIIDNDGTEPVIGTFAGLPEGAFLFLNSVKFQISYVGGTGNDVILTHVNTNSAFGNRSITGLAKEGNVVTVAGNIVEVDPLDDFALFVNWGDGTTETYHFDADAVGVSISHRYLDNRADGGQYPVFLDWRDPHGGGNQTTLYTTIENEAPALSVAGPGAVLRGQSHSFTFAASDASSVDEAANFRFVINWGDGTTQTIVGGRTQFVDHAFNSTGSRQVRVTAYDKDGAASPVVTKAVSVNGVLLAGGELTVAGTSSHDNILVSPADLAGGVAVALNGTQYGPYSGVDRIAIYGGNGNDNIRVRPVVIGGVQTLLQQTIYIDAGDGNDFVRAEGAGGGAILLGGNGADDLLGGLGRDLIIGGAGRDVVHGSAAEDCTVGGMTIHDGNREALDSLFAEWRRTDAPRQVRIDHLKGTQAGGVNGNYRLNRAALVDDLALDQLLADFGADWMAEGQA